MVEEFLACYNEVFNEDGSLKACGREKCIRLIEIAEQIHIFSGPNHFGSKETGFLNVVRMQALRNSLG